MHGPGQLDGPEGDVLVPVGALAEVELPDVLGLEGVVQQQTLVEVGKFSLANAHRTIPVAQGLSAAPL